MTLHHKQLTNDVPPWYNTNAVYEPLPALTSVWCSSWHNLWLQLHRFNSQNIEQFLTVNYYLPWNVETARQAVRSERFRTEGEFIALCDISHLGRRGKSDCNQTMVASTKLFKVMYHSIGNKHNVSRRCSPAFVSDLVPPFFCRFDFFPARPPFH